MEVATTQTRRKAKVKEEYELVCSALDGNQRSYTKLMERYYHSIYHTMLKMVNNPEDAADLTQEAFGKAFHKLPTYVPRYAFSTWLFKIAINNCIDHIRKKRLQFLSIDDPIEHNSDQDFSNNLRAPYRDPEERVIRNQRIDMMKTIVGELSVKYRTMIELRYYEEYSYEEIANELQIPIGTVKAQLFRAKELLFNVLNQPGAEAYLDSMVRRK